MVIIGLAPGLQFLRSGRRISMRLPFHFLLCLPLRFRQAFLIAIRAVDRLLCFREPFLVQYLRAPFAQEASRMVVRVVVHVNDLRVGDGELAGGAFMETMLAER